MHNQGKFLQDPSYRSSLLFCSQLAPVLQEVLSDTDPLLATMLEIRILFCVMDYADKNER